MQKNIKTKIQRAMALLMVTVVLSFNITINIYAMPVISTEYTTGIEILRDLGLLDGSSLSGQPVTIADMFMQSLMLAGGLSVMQQLDMLDELGYGQIPENYREIIREQSQAQSQAAAESRQELANILQTGVVGVTQTGEYVLETTLGQLTSLWAKAAAVISNVFEITNDGIVNLRIPLTKGYELNNNEIITYGGNSVSMKLVPDSPYQNHYAVYVNGERKQNVDVSKGHKLEVGVYSNVDGTTYFGYRIGNNIIGWGYYALSIINNQDVQQYPLLAIHSIKAAPLANIITHPATARAVAASIGGVAIDDDRIGIIIPGDVGAKDWTAEDVIRDITTIEIDIDIDWDKELGKPDPDPSPSPSPSPTPIPPIWPDGSELVPEYLLLTGDLEHDSNILRQIIQRLVAERNELDRKIDEFLTGAWEGILTQLSNIQSRIARTETEIEALPGQITEELMQTLPGAVIDPITQTVTETVTTTITETEERITKEIHEIQLTVDTRLNVFEEIMIDVRTDMEKQTSSLLSMFGPSTKTLDFTPLEQDWDLTMLFPFCIPFDLMRAIQGLQGSGGSNGSDNAGGTQGYNAAAGSVGIMPMSYTGDDGRGGNPITNAPRYEAEVLGTVIVIDFADFQYIANVIRMCLMLSFTIWLMIITSRVIRW